MELSIRQLRYVAAVAQAGSFTRAARRLFITTPSLSQQVAKLERQLGVKLLDRTSAGVRPTPAGREVLARAARLLELHDEVVSLARTLGAGPEAPTAALRVGFLPGTAGRQTGRLFDELRGVEPSVSLTMKQVPWGDQLSGLLDGELDAVFARPPVPIGELPHHLVLTEPRMLVVSRRHPLAGRVEVVVADLSDCVQVEAADAPEGWRAWWALDPRPDGSRARFGSVVHSLEEMLEVVAASHEVGITPQSIADAFPRPDIVFLPITDVSPASIELVFPPGPLSRPQCALLEAVTRVGAASDG
ncbi:LysR family transcriptional regulator [Streptomyces sp. NBC_00080]|uniref:LysR family transcriptional regulator n=1 Tax=Streptomyces sp. NBC_00080 TaxID=2975645 RepID=UPI003254498C